MKANEYLKDLKIVCSTKVSKGEFGSIKLKDVRREYIDQLTNELKKRPGRKNKTLGGTRINALLRTVTRSILDLAYASDYIPKNPHDWFESQREGKPNIDHLSFDELAAFLVALPNPLWVQFYTVLFGTGLRFSEIAALGWKHVDFKHKLLLIQQGLVNGRLTILKTQGSQRDVDMLPSAEEALRNYLQETQGEGWYVFSNTEGGPLHRDNIRNRIWIPTLKRARLNLRNPSQTRHTFASLMLEQGESPAWVAKMLGHTTLKMLYTRYGKYVRNRTRQDGMWFEEELRKARERSENHP